MTNENPKHPTCQECQQCHNTKYTNFVSEKGDVYTKFNIRCHLIPENDKFIPDNIAKQLEVDELLEAETLLDPVKWAEKHLFLPDGTPWRARWYQIAMLRCSAHRKVTRCGRRIGKTDCIAVDILHFTFTNVNKRVLVVAPYKSQVAEIFSRIKGFIENNPILKNSISKDVSSPYYQIELHNGSSIRGFTSGTKSGS
jgi:phage terminase large subunit GpA-like protein